MTLSREQVENKLGHLLNHCLVFEQNDQVYVKELKAHDAAQRAQIEALEQECQALRETLVLDETGRPRTLWAMQQELHDRKAQLAARQATVMRLADLAKQASERIREWHDEAQQVVNEPASVPYPGWCRHTDKCAGKVSCPLDPTCAD